MILAEAGTGVWGDVLRFGGCSQASWGLSYLVIALAEMFWAANEDLGVLAINLGNERCPSASSCGSLGSDLAPSAIPETMSVPECAGSAFP